MFKSVRAVAVLAMVLVGLVLSPLSMAAQQAPEETIRTITTTGVGRVTVEPDAASFVVALEARADTLQPAQDEVAEESQAIHDAMIAAGIPEKDIQTFRYDVQPVNKYDRNGNFVEIESYVVRQGISITVYDTEMVGELLDETISLGADYVGGISFFVSDPSPHIQQARQEAIADARMKAQDYADGSGSDLTGLLSLYESSSPLPTASDPTMDRSMAPAASDSSMAEAGGTTPEVSAGTTEIIVTVETTWTIQPTGDMAPVATPAN